MAESDMAFSNKRGNAFFTSCVHRILTRETYAGVLHYNQSDSRAQKATPKRRMGRYPGAANHNCAKNSDGFRAMLHAKRPSVTPTRITNSEVLLTGLARCESCGSALMLSTGKSGRYRYYACSASRLKGKSTARSQLQSRKPN